MINKELIQKRNEFSKQYREYEDKITEINKEIIRLKYRISEYYDEMRVLNINIMAIDTCL